MRTSVGSEPKIVAPCLSSASAIYLLSCLRGGTFIGTDRVARHETFNGCCIFAKIDSMRDVVVMSGWTWEAFNVPERIALALSQSGCRVLHCASPVSIFRSPFQPIREVSPGIHTLQTRFLSSRLCDLPGGAFAQAHMLRRQINAAARELGLHKPLFLYGWLGRLFPLCLLMRRDHFMVHICMDHSVSVDANYDRYLEISDKTLAIPRSCYQKYKAKFGSRVAMIPQSVDFTGLKRAANGRSSNSQFPNDIPRPRLGYLGPPKRNLNLPLLSSFLQAHPDWHFMSIGSQSAVPLPNAHALPWTQLEGMASYISATDVGFLPYDCYDEERLHGVPLKMFEYFAFGIPVVSTPLIHLWEYGDFVYLGDGPEDLAAAVRSALSEPIDSPKRAARVEIARRHSLENLATVLRECLPLDVSGDGIRDEAPNSENFSFADTDRSGR